jgi:predicted transcriptional regulator
MSEEVKFIRGNDRINQLAQRPDIAAEVAELTQVELARRMGITQAAISRMEQPHDLLLSTLNAYLQAIGGLSGGPWGRRRILRVSGRRCCSWPGASL